MRKVKCTCPQGIQLRLLGGMVYLQSNQEVMLTDMQMTHTTVQVAIKNGNLQVVPVDKPQPVAEQPAPVETIKKEKGPRTKRPDAEG